MKNCLPEHVAVLENDRKPVLQLLCLLTACPPVAVDGSTFPGITTNISRFAPVITSSMTSLLQLLIHEQTSLNIV